ncbi:MAG: helix-turn-helix domain-containing protein, partial [Stellaceae bacterium]
VLDISSIDPAISEHAHALTGALTAAAARAIEERLFRAEFRRDWVLAVRIPDSLGSTMLIAVNHDRRIVGADRTGRALLARLGHQFDGDGVCMSAVFERSEGLLQKKNRSDAWTQVQPLGTDDAWLTIATSPKPVFTRWRQSEIDTLRPRLDMLLAGRSPHQVESRVRGGLTPTTMRRVREYIDAHLNQNIDLESLAKTAGLSMFHFAHAFRQSEGTTPHDYVLECRVAKARELLLRPDLSLSDIAFAVGFADQSHFTRRFREAVGISPGQFRRSQG